MTTEPDRPQSEKRDAELMALGRFGVSAIVMATVCGAIIVSGWFAGVIQDVYERFFWAGSLLAALAITVMGAAVVIGGSPRAVSLTSRIGLAMFLVAPVFCVGSLVADFYF
jgi:hypothetical protein